MKYLVIGSSIAAAGAVEGIRSMDDAGVITLVDGEGSGIYSRPLISYFLADPEHHADITYRTPEWLGENRVDLVKGRAVTIDQQEKTVRLENGRALEYDRLLLATGSRPVVPPLPGVESPHVVPFYTLSDARRLSVMAESAREAVVVGSGLIGLKAAEALHALGVRVTIVEKEDRVLPRILTAEAGSMIAKFLEDAGIMFIPSSGVSRIEEKSVTVENHGRIKADIVVMAVGVRPRSELALAAGIEVGRGIVVDSQMRTSIPDVWAAGDVAETINKVTGERQAMALFPHAHRQGYVAGRSMAGGCLAYEGGVPVNAVRLPECTLLTAGQCELPGGQILSTIRGDQMLQIGVLNEKVVGFIVINMSKVAGPLHHAIETEYTAPLQEWTSFMEDPDLSRLPSSLWTAERGASHDSD